MNYQLACLTRRSTPDLRKGFCFVQVQSWLHLLHNVCCFVFVVWLFLGQQLKASGSGELLAPFPEDEGDKSTSGISFIGEPGDLQVCTGNRASFPCRASGTTAVAFWYINGSVYTIENLPPRFSYSNWTLSIPSVQASDHGVVLRCSWYIVSSRNATLSVVGESLDFGTVPSRTVCDQQPAPESFPVSADLLDRLRKQPGRFLSFNLDAPCGQFNQLILINADTGFPGSLGRKKNTLILIDPSEGAVWLNTATLEQDDSHLALVGVPAELALESSGSGANLMASGSDRAIVMIPADQRQPAIRCFNPWARCHFENLSFRQAAGQASVEASPLIELASNLDSVIKNCDFSGSRTFVQQRNGKLSVIASEFYTNSTHPAVIADQKTSICASSFYCDDQCYQAVLLTPDVSKDSPVRISRLVALGFPAAVVVSSEKNSEGVFVSVIIADSTIISNEEGNSTAIQLYGNLNVSFERNNITGCVMILNPGEEECINIEENDSFFIQIENSEETTYTTPVQTESSGEPPHTTPAQAESSGETLHLMPAFIWSLLFATSQWF